MPNKLAAFFLTLAVGGANACVLSVNDGDDDTIGGTAAGTAGGTSDGAATAADGGTTGTDTGVADETGGETPAVCDAYDAWAAECSPINEGYCAIDYANYADNPECLDALDAYYACIVEVPCDEANTACQEEVDTSNELCPEAGTTGGETGTTGDATGTTTGADDGTAGDA